MGLLIRSPNVLKKRSDRVFQLRATNNPRRKQKGPGIPAKPESVTSPEVRGSDSRDGFMNIPPIPGTPKLLVAGDKTRYLKVVKIRPPEFEPEPEYVFRPELLGGIYQMRMNPGETPKEAAYRLIESIQDPTVRAMYKRLIDGFFEE